MFLSITGVTADNRLAKYQPFEIEADADTHAAAYSGFVVQDPGGNQSLWTIDASAKTVTRDTDVEAAAATALAWEQVRGERNRLLTETDWWVLRGSITDAQTAYRTALRDLPANTADPSNPTWPEEPS